VVSSLAYPNLLGKKRLGCCCNLLLCITISVSKDDMEKLRQALKTLSEAEKQLRVSNDKTTWLTAALLRLAPDKQYVLPSSSTSTSFNNGVLVGSFRDRNIPRNSASKHEGNMAGTSYGERRPIDHTEHSHMMSTSAVRENERTKHGKTENEMIWQAVLESIQSDTLRKMMAKDGRLSSVRLGTGKISVCYPLFFYGHIMP
jgi:DNA polymerase III gamma/tau subunit